MEMLTLAVLVPSVPSVEALPSVAAVPFPSRQHNHRCEAEVNRSNQDVVPMDRRHQIHTDNENQ